MSKTLLFVYGQLKPEYDPPSSMLSAQPDSVAGDLYHRGEDAAAVGVNGSSKNRIHGYLLSIDSSELADLDREEAPEYKRGTCKLDSGQHAYIYHFRGKLTPKMTLIKSGIYKK